MNRGDCRFLRTNRHPRPRLVLLSFGVNFSKFKNIKLTGKHHIFCGILLGSLNVIVLVLRVDIDSKTRLEQRHAQQYRLVLRFERRVARLGQAQVVHLETDDD